MNILIPGRHHLLTEFQYRYISDIIKHGLYHTRDVNGDELKIEEKIDSIIFAVTSANHSNTRRNPIPFYQRAMALWDFTSALKVKTFIYDIDDVGFLKDFSTYTLKRLNSRSRGMLDLNCENTLVLCSTPVLEMYEASGFKILPCELDKRDYKKFNGRLPWEIVEEIAAKEKWFEDKEFLKLIHGSSLKLFHTYECGELIKILFSDSMIGDDGDLTETRDYNTYVSQMDEIAKIKYDETAPFVRSGRIGDIGCAVGSWIKLAANDERYRESDFYGVEVSRKLFDLCNQRKENGEFPHPYVFFAKKNAVKSLVYDRESMNTVHTSSLTHEIESYGGREDLIRFIKNRYEELLHGGIWINRDVVGPENGEEEILLWLTDEDGKDYYEFVGSSETSLKDYLNSLSTYGRFFRFAMDYRNKEGYELKFKTEIIDNKNYLRLKRTDAVEYISKKDYTDNWLSEMHETFTFFSFNDWKIIVEDSGFKVHCDSSAYSNPWIVKNRFEGKLEFYNGKTMEKEDYPVTNMLLLCEKI